MVSDGNNMSLFFSKSTLNPDEPKLKEKVVAESIKRNIIDFFLRVIDYPLYYIRVRIDDIIKLYHI